MKTLQLVYVSGATHPFTVPELEVLLLKARTCNTRLGITGLLVFHKGSFLQVLEGEETIVEKLYEEKISRDPRHEHVTTLLHRYVDERSFGDWSMAFVSTEDPAAAALGGFIHYARAQSSFLNLQGDPVVVGKIIDGFHEGRWHQVDEALVH